MVARDTRRERVARAAARVRAALGEELRLARLGTGLSLDAVGAEVGMSREKVRRVERGSSPAISLADMAAIAAVVGLDLSVKLYPGARPLRDVAHVRLLGRFRARIHPSLGWQPETPLPIPGDRRAWDAVIHGDGFRVGVEGENHLGDLQALERRVALKGRDGGIERIVLVVADTRHNREVLRVAAGVSLALFPLSGRAIMSALSEGRDPGGSGIVIL